MSAEEPNSEETAEAPENPFMHVDYRVFEVTVQGGAEDSVEDVNEIVEERLQEALNQIEELKRTDFQLDDEFDIDRTGTQSGPSFS